MAPSPQQDDAFHDRRVISTAGSLGGASGPLHEELTEVCVRGETSKDLGGEAVAFSHHGEEQVLGSDVVVVDVQSLTQ